KSGLIGRFKPLHNPFETLANSRVECLKECLLRLVERARLRTALAAVNLLIDLVSNTLKVGSRRRLRFFSSSSFRLDEPTIYTTGARTLLLGYLLVNLMINSRSDPIDGRLGAARVVMLDSASHDIVNRRPLWRYTAAQLGKGRPDIVGNVINCCIA